MNYLTFRQFLLAIVMLAGTLHSTAGCNDPGACNYSALDLDDLDCCYDNCLTLTMWDSFGDGWNGAIFYLINQTTLEGDSGTMATGSGPESIFYCFEPGCYSFEVTPGTFAGEVSWQLDGPDGGTITGGAPATVFFTLGSPANCDPGCTEEDACNYDPDANVNDGSRTYECLGCTDPTACNYDDTATLDDGSCVFSPENDICENAYFRNVGETSQGTLCCSSGETANPCLPLPNNPINLWYVYNTGDCEALSFTAQNISGNSVGLTIWEDLGGGCANLNPIACCPEAQICAADLHDIYDVQPFTNYYFTLFTTDSIGCGEFMLATSCEALGCTDPSACNYNPAATDDDGSCTYVDACGECGGTGISGCMDASACNFNPSATCDSGSCTYPSEVYLDCDGECINDTNDNGICDELDVAGCTFEGACNYNPDATYDDNTCFFATAVYDCDGNCQSDEDGDGICDQNEGQNGADFCGENTVWDPITQTCVGFDTCPQDFSGNGQVDALDLLLFLELFGEPCSP